MEDEAHKPTLEFWPPPISGPQLTLVGPPQPLSEGRKPEMTPPPNPPDRSIAQSPSGSMDFAQILHEVFSQGTTLASQIERDARQRERSMFILVCIMLAVGVFAFVFAFMTNWLRTRELIDAHLETRNLVYDSRKATFDTGDRLESRLNKLVTAAEKQAQAQQRAQEVAADNNRLLREALVRKGAGHATALYDISNELWNIRQHQRRGSSTSPPTGSATEAKPRRRNMADRRRPPADPPPVLSAPDDHPPEPIPYE